MLSHAVGILWFLCIKSNKKVQYMFILWDNKNDKTIVEQLKRYNKNLSCVKEDTFSGKACETEPFSKVKKINEKEKQSKEARILFFNSFTFTTSQTDSTLSWAMYWAWMNFSSLFWVSFFLCFYKTGNQIFFQVYRSLSSDCICSEAFFISYFTFAKFWVQIFSLIL